MTAARAGDAAMLDRIAYAGMFVFGIVMALLGAVMPVLTARLSLGLDDVGTLFLVTNGAMLAASLLVGPAMDRFGLKRRSRPAHSWWLAPCLESRSRRLSAACSWPSRLSALAAAR